MPRAKNAWAAAYHSAGSVLQIGIHQAPACSLSDDIIQVLLQPLHLLYSAELCPAAGPRQAHHEGCWHGDKGCKMKGKQYLVPSSMAVQCASCRSVRGMWHWCVRSRAGLSLSVLALICTHPLLVPLCSLCLKG